MNITETKNDPFFHVNQQIKKQNQKYKAPVITRFIHYTKRFAFFNLFFCSLIAIECILFFIFFNSLITSSVLAINLAAIFATIFLYLLLRLHLQAQKPEMFAKFCHEFADDFQEHSHYDKNKPEYHIALANGFMRVVSALQGKEYRYYRLPRIFEPITSSLPKISFWFHWYDVHKMKETLLSSAIKQYIQMIKKEPTNLELHAALANAYVLLSALYRIPKKTAEESSLPFFGGQFLDILDEKFKHTAELAIEEFKILNEYAPNDPWVHEQLAYSYQDLQMPEEEIKEYEILLSLKPHEDEILYKLGVLHFKQGANAKGLEIYDRLKSSNALKAEGLIQYYGAYKSE